MNTFDQRYKWAQQFIPEAMIIAHRELGSLVIRTENMLGTQDDLKKSTDLLIGMVCADEGRICLRTRQPRNWKSMELQMRYQTLAGSFDTEYKKLNEGAGRYYLLTWEDPKRLGTIGRYTGVDLNKMRTIGFFALGKHCHIPGQEPYMMWKIDALAEAGLIAVANFPYQQGLI